MQFKEVGRMKTKQRPRVRLIFAILILSSCIGCDQVTKTIATQSLKDSPPKSFLADTVRLDYALNPGGFLSLGSNLPDEFRKWIFIGFNSCMMLALCVFLTLKRDLPLPLFLSVAFILAGGIGNLIDRLWNNGLVTDFINLGIGPIRTGVFNVADIAVTFGAIAIGWLSIKRNTGEPGDAPESRSRSVSE
jgi:signal peptidase II